jgi:ADP-ribose pyrophosphatase
MGALWHRTYVLEYPTWVNVVALTQDHHIVLVRQYRHGVQQTVLELPSGTVEATDVSPLAAIQRELLEETGYSGALVVETGRLSPNSANHANWTYCFLATGVERVAEPLAEETECVETVLMPLSDVVRLASQGGLLQTLHVGALFFALHALGGLPVQ